MGLPRSPARSSSANTGAGETGAVGPSDPAAEVANNPPPGTSAVIVPPSSPEPDMVRFFRQEAERLHTAATILTHTTEEMLREGFRRLATSKNAIDTANIAGSISKTAYLNAEKRYSQTRTAVLQRVKAMNPQVKNLTDLIRHDIPYRNGQEATVSGGRTRKGTSGRRRSFSRSPQLPEMRARYHSTGFQPIHPEPRVHSAPPYPQLSANLAFAFPSGGTYVDPAMLAGPYGPLLLQGLLYQQQQAQQASG